MPEFRVGKQRTRVENADTVAVGAVFVDYWVWDFVRYEDPAAWDPMAPTNVPILKTGLYLITAGIEAGPVGGVNVTAGMIVYAGGGFRGSVRAPAGDTFVGAAYSTVLELAATDYVALFVYLVTDGTGWDVYPGTTHLTVTRIGPERWT